MWREESWRLWQTGWSSFYLVYWVRSRSWMEWTGNCSSPPCINQNQTNEIRQIHFTMFFFHLRDSWLIVCSFPTTRSLCRRPLSSCFAKTVQFMHGGVISWIEWRFGGQNCKELDGLLTSSKLVTDAYFPWARLNDSLLKVLNLSSCSLLEVACRPTTWSPCSTPTCPSAIAQERTLDLFWLRGALAWRSCECWAIFWAGLRQHNP